MTTKSLTSTYFEELYSKNPDPWNFKQSNYERDKYVDTIASLGRTQYGPALEVGCSVGVLTEMLARRCETLISTDISNVALEEAKQRCAGIANVSFEKSELPDRAPARLFDLFVLSEVLYYFGPEDLERVKTALLHASAPGAHFLLVHFTPLVEEYPQTGDAVHEAFLNDPRFVSLAGHRAERYRVDLLSARLS